MNRKTMTKFQEHAKRHLHQFDDGAWAIYCGGFGEPEGFDDWLMERGYIDSWVRRPHGYMSEEASWELTDVGVRRIAELET